MLPGGILSGGHFVPQFFGGHFVQGTFCPGGILSGGAFCPGGIMSWIRPLGVHSVQQVQHEKRRARQRGIE